MATASKPSKSKAKPIGNGAVAKAPRKAASSPRKAKVGKPPSEATEAASGLPEASGAPWREDARVQTARKNVHTLVSGYNHDEMIDEILNLHLGLKSRSLRTLKGNKDVEATLVDANLDSQATRSRIAEIDMRALVPVLKAKVVIDFTGDYLRDTYGAFLNTAARTQADRQSLIDAVFLREMQEMRMLDAVRAVAEKAMKDIDQAAFRLGSTVEMLKRGSSRV